MITFGFAEVEIKNESHLYLDSIIYLGKKQKFGKDGFYLNKWTDLKWRQCYDEPIKLSSKEEVLPFLLNLIKLKPGRVNSVEP